MANNEYMNLAVNEKLYTFDESAKVLRVSKLTIRNYIDRGLLKTTKISPRKIYIIGKELNNLINDNTK